MRPPDRVRKRQTTLHELGWGTLIVLLACGTTGLLYTLIDDVEVAIDDANIFLGLKQACFFGRVGRNSREVQKPPVFFA